jgi:hypothetical protein
MQPGQCQAVDAAMIAKLSAVTIVNVGYRSTNTSLSLDPITPHTMAVDARPVVLDTDWPRMSGHRQGDYP